MRIAAEYERRIANEWKSSMNRYTNPYTAVWVSDLKDATPFRTEREAQAVKGQVKDVGRKERYGRALLCRALLRVGEKDCSGSE